MAKHTQKNELCVTRGKAFAKKARLHDHQRSVPEQNYNLEARLVCPFTSCTRKFLTKKKFQDHVNTHTGVKPFSCTVCSKDFHSRYYKSKHEKVCTGETSTTCEICGKSVCDTSSLSRHRRTQHQGRQFTCRCGKRFRNESSLVRHQKNKKHGELNNCYIYFQIILVIEPGVYLSDVYRFLNPKINYKGYFFQAWQCATLNINI